MDDANAVDVAGVPASTQPHRPLELRYPTACLDSGFFYVINHGVSQDLMEEVFVQSRRFFGLPLSEKMKLVRNEKHQSYTPLFDQVLHPANQINGLCLKILLLKMDIDASDIAKFL
ncbi:probable 2-oxoglutarate-dependent dioxygenase At3g49630 [Eucalyptus grandis]|uniref:probable 2-oxoglutarate-dependent dioxygenase At3g49630 n=1 Tax=Eucalyptus grandis TaxID=71139 RepID=UPI00192F0E1D|nr:probable 2-oxoglutarate-dependent dioxygenase At3g49630 [Eucalyptus grandis]